VSSSSSSFTCLYKGMEKVVRTNDIRFMKRGPQPIQLSLGDIGEGVLREREQRASLTLVVDL
jgi:hypothetical protein